MRFSKSFFLRCQTEFPFPALENTDEDGLLAYGGDLNLHRLISAYSQGIFPWYSQEPILWFSPDPRMVLYPTNLKISKSLKKELKKDRFEITFDRAFDQVIHSCAEIRKGDTWITNAMINAYIELHQFGLAHSCEGWLDNQLVGGLYGVSIGNVYFGESMFYKEKNASKVCFVKLIEKLQDENFALVDCQVETEYLRSLGAELIERDNFIDIVNSAINYETIIAW